MYQEHGVEGFRIGYIGSEGFLSAEERTAVIAWLKDQKQWNVPLLQQHLKTTYEVEYQSLQSYYDLLKAAGLSWKKTQAQSPKKTMYKSPQSERS
ncbi:MAG: winged helix-turn-helix domain-containing protein [Chloroflexaceae bacterium]